MKIVDFSNAIDYNENSITEYNPYQTVNLSSFLYSSDLKLPIPTLSSAFFHLKNILYTEYVQSVEINGKYITITYPAIAELLETFKYHPYKPMTTNTLEEAKIVEKDIKANIKSLFETIEVFIHSREKVLSGQKLPIYCYTDEEKEKILELITLVNYSFIDFQKEFNDYIHDIHGNTTRTKYKLNLDYLYNYKTLKEFFKFLALQDTEYYTFDNEKEMIEYRLYELNSIPFSDIESEEEIDILEEKLRNIERLTNFINNEPFFTKEFFATFSLMFDKLVEEENAIDKFVKTILNINETKQNVIIKDNMNIVKSDVIIYGKPTEVL